jgi:hypothetical protein
MIKMLTRSLLVLALGAGPGLASDESVRALVVSGDWPSLKAQGPTVLPTLVELYRRGSEEERAQLALAFYQLSWKSPQAKAALMQDVHTNNPHLRLQVQWALGRVSADDDVVQTLLQNMQSDGNPLFRDKAACALAYDQVHLTPAQKIKLYEGLVHALEDPKPDVRRIAALALQIHTGTARGFNGSAPPAERAAALAAWKRWLEEYRAQY